VNVTRDPPDLTVLLATRNRAALLAQTLQGIAEQRLGDLIAEIVVAENGSTDDTQQVLADFRTRLPLTVVHEPTVGKSRALNRALAVADGALLVFTDDDVVPDADWLATLKQVADRWPAHAIIGGRVTPLYPPDTPAWLRTHGIAAPAFSWFEPASEEGPISITPFGPNFAVQAAALHGLAFAEEIGPAGDDYAMGCESELLRRLVARGERIVYTPDATVAHVIRPEQLTHQWLFARAFRYGRGQTRMEAAADVPLLAGIPRHLWRTLAGAWLQMATARWRGARAWLERGWEFHFVRGVIAEERARRRAPESAPRPS
jgi:GT2 family glycosyltransferase